MLFHSDSRNSPRLLALAIAGVIGFAATPAFAETGSAAAQDVTIHIDLLGVAQLNVDPQAPVSITNASTAAYEQDSLPGLDIGGALLHLGAGHIVSEAEYDPGVAISAAGATSTVENLDLSAVGVLGEPLLSITAALIKSHSQVMGYCLPTPGQSRDLLDDIAFFNGFDEGNISSGGPRGVPDPEDVVLDDLGISILGIPVTGLPTNPPPNTVIDLAQLGIAGATLILNEQTLGGDGVNMGSLTSNAVHLTLDVAGLITADTVIAHSDSKLDCTQ